MSSGSQYGQNQKTLQYHNTSQPRGECGTVYFPDDQLLHCDPINVSGQIYMDEPKWSVPSLGIYDRTVMFPQDGFELTVAGNVVVSGGVARAAALYVGGARLVTFATNRSGGENGFRRCGWTDEPCRFTVGGSLHLGRFAECVINSAATDAALTDVPDAAYVDVGGTIRIDADAAFWCSSHPYLGGSPRITCRKLIVAKGGKITASGEGYLGGLSATGTWGPAWYDASIVGADVRTDEYGFGPGAVRGVVRAGCHGGFASSVSDPKWLYGNEERPCMPGSGGGGAIGGVGGGGGANDEARSGSSVQHPEVRVSRPCDSEVRDELDEVLLVRLQRRGRNLDRRGLRRHGKGAKIGKLRRRGFPIIF